MDSAALLYGSKVPGTPRLHAIKLLDSSSHREGIWLAKIVACVARKVMEIEERDFYEDSKDDDFSFYSPLKERHLILPTLPDSYRIHEVEVLLPDDPVGNFGMLCRQLQDNGTWNETVREYDVFFQCWIDRAGRRGTSAVMSGGRKEM